jgi:hypothetical protein
VSCLAGCLRLLVPRLVILGFVLFGDYLGRAYATTLWPLLGFVFLPLTTLAYAWAVNDLGGTEGRGLLAIVVAVLLDLGLFRRRRGPETS